LFLSEHYSLSQQQNDSHCKTTKKTADNCRHRESSHIKKKQQQLAATMMENVDDTNTNISTTLTFRVDLWDRFNEIHTKLTIGKQNVKDLQALAKAQHDSYDAMAKQMGKTKILIDEKNL
jgi:hypothetical protein